jgi:hypothetical protein
MRDLLCLEFLNYAYYAIPNPAGSMRKISKVGDMAAR